MAEEQPVGKFKILIVDDEIIMTRTAKYIFGKTHDVTCANSLAEGLAAIENQEFDAALVDDQMPDGRGPELLLKLVEKWPNCLRYLVTANLGIVDELDESFFKMVVYTPKPVNLQALLHELNAALPLKIPRTLTQGIAPSATPTRQA